VISRVIEVGAAYVESLKILMIAVHGLLFFIVLTAISAALSFATLYKWETHNSDHEAVRNRASLFLMTETRLFRV